MVELATRLEQLAAAPDSVVKEVPKAKWGDYWEMAKIGMPATSATVATFAGDKLVSQAPLADIAAALAEAQGTGYLVQGEGSAGLYVHGEQRDLLLQAARSICRSDDCHCG